MKNLEKYFSLRFVFAVFAFSFGFVMSMWKLIILIASITANHQGVVEFTIFEKIFQLFFLLLALVVVYLGFEAIGKARASIEEDLKKQNC